MLPSRFGSYPVAVVFAAAFFFSCNCQGPGINNGTDGGVGVFDGGLSDALYVEPAMAEVVVKQKNVTHSQQFVAKDAKTMVPLTVGWVLDRDDLGKIDQSGLFTTQSLVGGIIKVRANSNGLWAEATLLVRVEIKEDDPAGTGPVDPDTLPHLNAPTPNTGTQGPKILYPYANTVFPRGIISPLVQYDPMGFQPKATRVTITAPNFIWTGDMKVNDSNKPRFVIPEDIWDVALRNASGGPFSLDVIQASKTAGYGPTHLPLVAAPGSLKGSVYYMTYDDAKLGVWRVQTDTKEAPTHTVKGCTVCHSVSANGQHLVTGGEAGNNGGVYQLLPDGGLPKISDPPSGLGGDSRGLSFAFLTPDGKYVLRSTNDFWGGPNLRAFRIDNVGQKLTEAEVVGMGTTVSAYVPTISPDGRFIAFTSGLDDMAGPSVTRTRNLSLMDLAVDETVMPAGRLTFSNRRTIVDTGAMGPLVKFAAFLPDTQRLVYQENTGSCSQYGNMLPTWDPSCVSYSRSQGRLMYIDTAAGTTPLPMAKANHGLDATAEWKNYEPFSLPALSGGYYWVVFTSTREYGNTYQATDARKQLWVAAVSPNAPAGQDPSHPAFYLPNQLDTHNERGYWAMDPCKGVGELCGAGDECCEGFCREPQPGSAKVCSTKPATCSLEGERCQTAADCCPPFEGSGLQCLGGFCTNPAGPTGDGGIN